MQIEDRELDDEKATDHFTRTRPGEPVPEWVSQGWEDAAFLDFRKPDVCPLGIRR